MLLILAEITSSSTAPAVQSAAKNIFVSLAILMLGVVVGGVALLATRNQFKKWYTQSPMFELSASVLEKLLAFFAGTVGGGFELFKPSTFKAGGSFTWTLYGVEGAVIAAAFALPKLISLAKENEKARIQHLQGQLGIATDQRDKVIEAVASWGGVLEAKKNRLQTMGKTGNATPSHLVEALSPSVQIQLLMKALHEHFSRHLPKPHTLRVGVYMRDPSAPNTLSALYSWDGSKNNCFSNRHAGIMNIDAPGGARSLLVQCFRSDKELHLVADCAEESRKKDNPFVYFSDTQRERIKSMLAYRYLLRDGDAVDAMILTMDTTQTGFFAPEREPECKIVLHEIGRRIEFELAALNLIKKLPSLPLAP